MASSERSPLPLVFAGRVGTRRAVLRAEADALAVEVGEGPQRAVPWADLRALEVRHELRWVGLTPIDGEGPGPMVVLGPGEVPEVLALVRWLRREGREVRYSATPAAYLRNELAVATSAEVALRSLGPGARALDPAALAPMVRAARNVAWWACGWGLVGPLAVAAFVGGLVLAGGAGVLPAFGLSFLAFVVLSVIGLHLSNQLLPRAAAWLGIPASKDGT